MGEPATPLPFLAHLAAFDSARRFDIEQGR